MRTTPCSASTGRANSSTPAEIDWIHRSRGARGTTSSNVGRSKFHAKTTSSSSRWSSSSATDEARTTRASDLDLSEIGERSIDGIDDRDERTGRHYRLASIVQVSEESPDSPTFSNPAR